MFKVLISFRVQASPLPSQQNQTNLARIILKSNSAKPTFRQTFTTNWPQTPTTPAELPGLPTENKTTPWGLGFKGLGSMRSGIFSSQRLHEKNQKEDGQID